MQRIFSLACLLAVATQVAGDFLVSERVYRLLSEAEEQLQQQSYARVLEVVDRALGGGRLNDYERALFQRLAGNALIGAGDHAAAASRFEKALAAATLPAAVHDHLRYQLARLYLHQERYSEALALLGKWMHGVENPSSEACFLFSSAYAALERLPEALEWGERGLAKAEAPDERQHEFVAGLNLSLKRYPRAAEVLESLVENHPETARHWRQLTAVYSTLERFERALAVAELGYLQGVLTSDADVDLLAKLYLHRQLPHKASVLLERALQASADFNATRYHLLGSAWSAAREYASALAPLKKAIDLFYAGGEKEKAARARLMKGVAHIHLEQYAEARLEFERCLEIEATRIAADQWLAYLAQIVV